jgi:hypothetical protein
MFGHFLTSEERVFVEELRSNTRDKGTYMKLSVLILLDMDKGYDEIEAILGIGRGSFRLAKSSPAALVSYDQVQLPRAAP